MLFDMGADVGFTLGPDIYTGWVAGGVGLTAGIILILASCWDDEDEDEDFDNEDEKLMSRKRRTYHSDEFI